jgi:hypothetical protein
MRVADPSCIEVLSTEEIAAFRAARALGWSFRYPPAAPVAPVARVVSSPITSAVAHVLEDDMRAQREERFRKGCRARASHIVCGGEPPLIRSWQTFSDMDDWLWERPQYLAHPERRMARVGVTA